MAQILRGFRDVAKSEALYRVWAPRLFSAQAATAPVTDDSTTASVAIKLSGNDCMLVQLKNRPWAPFTTLPQSVIQEWNELAGSGEMPQEVAVVRDAFTPHNQPQRPLGQLLKQTSKNTMVVSTDLCRAPTRAVVDVYAFMDSANNYYSLAVPSLDILQYLWGQEMRMSLTAGDVASAAPVAATTAKQSSNEIMMIAPTAFGFNEQTAEDNHFMNAAADTSGDGEPLVNTVTREFAGLHHVLSEVHGVHVHLMQHNLAHGTPDAVFPNNWFSTHSAAESLGKTKKSTMVLYPMKTPNRAAERRPELQEFVKYREYKRVVDMVDLEAKNKYFEGTGVLVIDRVNGVAYVSTSERADIEAAKRWVDELNYSKLVTFESLDSSKQTIYHTNVMMAIGTSVAVVCGESIADPKERQHLFETLGKTHEIIDITHAQMDQFCGNVLEVEDGRGLPVMAMSTQAYHGFTEEQRQTILRHCADIAHAPVDTIERVGGGGVRCMLAELF